MKLVAVLNRIENTKEMDINYLNAVSDNGAIPVLINENNLELIKFCGGILLTGGDEKGTLYDYLINSSAITSSSRDREDGQVQI